MKEQINKKRREQIEWHGIKRKLFGCWELHRGPPHPHSQPPVGCFFFFAFCYFRVYIRFGGKVNIFEFLNNYTEFLKLLFFNLNFLFSLSIYFSLSLSYFYLPISLLIKKPWFYSFNRVNFINIQYFLRPQNKKKLALP